MFEYRRTLLTIATLLFAMAREKVLVHVTLTLLCLLLYGPLAIRVNDLIPSLGTRFTMMRAVRCVLELDFDDIWACPRKALAMSMSVLIGVSDDTLHISRLLGVSYYVLIRMLVVFSWNDLLVRVSVRLRSCPIRPCLLVLDEHWT